MLLLRIGKKFFFAVKQIYVSVFDVVATLKFKTE